MDGVFEHIVSLWPRSIDNSTVNETRDTISDAIANAACAFVAMIYSVYFFLRLGIIILW